jgi:dolichol-phosphate mannosyltransferase
MKTKIHIVLPAYNEEASLDHLLKRLDFTIQDSNLDAVITIVNDGSTDKTMEVAKNFRGNSVIKIIDQQPNKGLAETIKNGLFAVVHECQDEDIIIVMDADNSHTPGLMLRMVNLIKEGCDIVIASRYQKGARIKGLSNSRKLLSLGASWLFRVLVGIPHVRDYTCGYRAYKAEILKKAFAHYKENFIKQTGFSCMIEILLRMIKFDPIIEEVPLILRYDMKESLSKMKVSLTIKQTLKMLFNYKFNSDY